jgi:hypothetical protein
MQVPEFFKSRPFQIFIIVAIVVAVIYYAGKAAGKRKAEEAIVKYPDNGQGIPKGWDPKPLSDRLYIVLKGIWTLAGEKEVPIYDAWNLPTKDMLAALNNRFNSDYLKEGKGTLIDWLTDEWNVLAAPKSKRDALVLKLKAIGAK